MAKLIIEADNQQVLEAIEALLRHSGALEDYLDYEYGLDSESDETSFNIKKEGF